MITTWLPDSGLGHNVDHVLAQFISDCQAGTLPQVSWIVAPYQWCEHPTARPADGAVYQQAVIQALWDNPKLWESTALFIDYDENDGFFDHVLPPQAPPGTPGELLSPAGTVATPGGPLVPDRSRTPGAHDGRLPVEPRRMGQLAGPRPHIGHPFPRGLDGRARAQHLGLAAGDLRRPDGVLRFHPSVVQHAQPARRQSLSGPDRRTRRHVAGARPAPGRPAGRSHPGIPAPRTPVLCPTSLRPTSAVAGGGGSGHESAWATPARPPCSSACWRLTCPARRPSSSTSAREARRSPQYLSAPTTYDIWVNGPNGFVRHFTGDVSVGVEATLALAGSRNRPGLALTLTNKGGTSAQLSVAGIGGHHGSRTDRFELAAGRRRVVTLDPLTTSDGWYDVRVSLDGRPSFLRSFAGHLEDGEPSVTG